MIVRLRKISALGDADDTVVTDTNLLIGRAGGCGLRLACPMVSRAHCELLLRDDSVVVHDLGSKNGTWVNGDPVDSQKPLSHGDVLRLGTFFLQVLIDPPAGPPIGGALPVSLSDQAYAIDDVPEILLARPISESHSAAC